MVSRDWSKWDVGMTRDANGARGRARTRDSVEVWVFVRLSDGGDDARSLARVIHLERQADERYADDETQR